MKWMILNSHICMACQCIIGFSLPMLHISAIIVISEMWEILMGADIFFSLLNQVAAAGARTMEMRMWNSWCKITETSSMKMRSVALGFSGGCKWRSSPNHDASIILSLLLALPNFTNVREMWITQQSTSWLLVDSIASYPFCCLCKADGYGWQDCSYCWEPF